MFSVMNGAFFRRCYPQRRRSTRLPLFGSLAILSAAAKRPTYLPFTITLDNVPDIQTGCQGTLADSQQPGHVGRQPVPLSRDTD